MEKLLAWVEIPTENFDRAVDFYNNVFGLELEKQDFGTEKMAFFPKKEGALIQAEGYKPSQDGSIVSFNVPDTLDTAIDAIKKNGGKILVPKTKIDAEGRAFFAISLDSEGNKIGLYGK
ncbi:MAG: VOC family protein [Hyphomicrobiales bacterium]